MPARWIRRLAVCLLVAVAPAALAGQSATLPLTAHRAVLQPDPPSPHHKQLVASFDSLGDSTHLTVVTHNGKFFLTVQRPRLTWSAAYAGRTPGPAPAEVTLEFRTQSPQVPLDSRLVIASSAGPRLEVGSAGAHSDPGAFTVNHFMRFPIPAGALAAVLAGGEVTVSVGGVRERLKPEHVEALRDLLSRVGALP